MLVVVAAGELIALVLSHVQRKHLQFQPALSRPRRKNAFELIVLKQSPDAQPYA